MVRINGVDFADFTEEEEAITKAIIIRAGAIFKALHKRFYKQSFYMDLSATHAKTPLDLQKLLAFDDFNFKHDVFGIIRHLNRATGELGDCFLPRCAKPKED